jgi:proline dehydrogenase
MEDSPCTSDTLEIYSQLRREFDNVGCVVQAYLKRSESDVNRLVQGALNVRLCKGIYIEPAEIAIEGYEPVDKNYILLMELIMRNQAYIGIATHDEALVSAAIRLTKDLKVGKDKYEFQMLLGVRPDLRDAIVRDGHRMRVYVPFGTHWYGYSVRRLKENPRIAGYVIKSIFSFGKLKDISGQKAD